MKIIPRFFLTNKVFAFSIAFSVLFILLLFSSVQNLVILTLNRIFNTEILWNSVWKHRFIEHSIKSIFVILSVGAVLQFFKFDKTQKIDMEHRVVASDINKLFPNSALFFFYFVVCAFFILSICSTCSFLYPFHTWDDSNCFFTVGKSVWFGKVMYRDLFEQKGPLLYFIHSVAYLISHRSFAGVFCFEIIAAAIFMFFCWKTLSLFSDEKIGLLVPFIAVIAYSSTGFVLGDSAEEFCLPFFMCSLYVSIRHIKKNSLFTRCELVATGIFAGCVLWIKFSLLGFYIGWCIVPIYLYVQKKLWKKIISSFALVMGGIFIATVPYILYFGANHAIMDWLEVYIYDNIFLYTSGEKGSPLQAVVKGLFRFYWRNYFYFFASILSSVVLFKVARDNGKAIGAHIVTIFATTSLFIYGGGRAYEYYGFDLCLFFIFSLLPLYEFINQNFFCKESLARKRTFVLTGFAFLCISFVSAFLITKNKEVLKIKRDDLPQFKFDKIISQYENPTLLNYGTLDCGFYTVSGIIPVNRFFIKIHLPVKEMDYEQNKIISEGIVDFVVSKTPLKAEKYTLVSAAQSNIRNHSYDFYLYKRLGL